MNPLDDADRLRALDETGLLDRPSRESLDRYVRIASAALGVPVSLVSLVDSHRQFFSSAIGLPEPWASSRQTPLSHSFCQHVVTEGTPLIVEDAREHPLVRDNLAIPDLSVIAYAGVPVGAGGEILGSFCAIDSRPRAWSARELGILSELAAAVSAEMELFRRASRAERSERQLAALNEELTQLQESATHHTATMVHDLRTPLGVVSLGLQSILLHEAVGVHSELLRLLGMMQRNVEHAAALLTAQRDPADPLPGSEGGSAYDLTVVAREVCADLAGRGPAVELTLAGHLDGLSIRLDRTGFRRCCENLLTNAERFARSRIRVDLAERHGEVVLAVEDDGPGLPSPEAYRRVWDRGIRYHVEEGRSGSGLGLSIVKDLVESGGGSVEARLSDLGGARFTLRWPAVVSACPPA